MKRLTTWALIGVMLGALGLAPAAAAEPLKIRYSIWVGYGPLFLARDKGYFKAENVDVELINMDDPKEGFFSMAAGRLDGVVSTVDTMVLYLKTGKEFQYVLALDDSAGGDAIVARKEIKAVKDLKGKKVGIWPGSTQEVFIMERLRMEGLTIKDITPVRVPFGEMPAMLARGDIDAYVGAEPAPALSITSGVGQLVEYPYGTAMGGLNMIFGTHEDTVAKNPDLVRTMLKIQRQATEFMMANKPVVADTTVQKLGANRAAVEQALGANNVEYVWKLDPTVQTQVKTYAQHMLELKQIRALPKFASFLNPKFSDEIAAS